MDRLTEIKNHILNVKATILKLQHDEKLTQEEKNYIVQFYIEIADYVSTLKSE